MRRRAPALATLVGLAAALLSACGIGLPDEGPVVETTVSGSNPREDAPIINPRHPGEGDTPEQIVRGFVDAMEATPPIQTGVAREFLTPEASEQWDPQGIIAYSTVLTSSTRGTDEVTMTLDDPVQTDGRGTWLGPLDPDEVTVRVPVEQQEDGEWRITDPPDHIMVSRSFFESRLRQVNLYFFDPSVSILVPEPVFVPRGLQFASTLVGALLQGPPDDLATSELTFLPDGLRPDVSVAVSEGGVARVDLKSDSEDVVVDPPEAERLVAQLAWTLRQDPTIRRFTLSVAGQPVKLPTGDSEFSVGNGGAYAPYGADASTLLFGLAGGRLVRGEPETLEAAPGPFGRDDYDLRSVGVDLTGSEAAGVTSDGTTLWRGSVSDPGDTPSLVISDGVDLLDPAWDFRGRLWAVDRRAEGAVVHYGRGGRMRTLQVDGITGADVKDFLVSRDGSRLVAVVRRGSDDAVVASRILTARDGQVVAALAARDITASDAEVGRIRDIEWRTPTSIAYLQPVAKQYFQVRTVSIDGATLGVDDVVKPLADDVSELVGSPTPREPIYAFAAGSLLDVAETSEGPLVVPPGVTSLTYVG